VGDGAKTGTPKAGVFAEGAALAVASALIAKLRNGGKATEYKDFGTCCVEFGGGRIGKVEVHFFSGPSPTENTTSRRSIYAPKRSFSVPVAAPAGSVSDVFRTDRVGRCSVLVITYEVIERRVARLPVRVMRYRAVSLETQPMTAVASKMG
jgi:hypothetical protein